MTPAEEKLARLAEPVRRACAFLRQASDIARNDEDWARMGNMASWLEGVYDDAPAYSTGPGASPVDAVVASLNDAFAADPAALHALACNRVPCSRALADHEHVVVDTNPVVAPDAGGDPRYAVDALGLVNGVLHALGLPDIVVKFADEPDEYGRRHAVGFCRRTPTGENP